MTEKDNWDKFDILMKIVILGFIPMVIKIGADKVAQSLATANLVNSSISSLVDGNNKKRDIALIALDYAIPKIICSSECEKKWKEDQVVDIATVLIDDVVTKNQQPNVVATENQLLEVKVARKILTRRTSEEFYNLLYQYNVQAKQTEGTSSKDVSQDNKPSQEEVNSKQNRDAIIKAMQPPLPLPTKNSDKELDGIRLVYIQYDSKDDQAKKLQEALQKEISLSAAPGTQYVTGIKESSIRYANPADEELAKKLQAYLKNMNPSISIEKLIDLSKAGYKVPSGQLEVWLHTNTNP
jgi:hypothetical protein